MPIKVLGKRYKSKTTIFHSQLTVLIQEDFNIKYQYSKYQKLKQNKGY